MKNGGREEEEKKKEKKRGDHVELINKEEFNVEKEEMDLDQIEDRWKNTDLFDK